jgi:predicted negative regulator of RcsB-dependent stress response
MAAMLALHVLGSPYISTSTGRTPLRHKEAALLAYLAENKRASAISRDIVAAMFWPRSGTTRSLRSLSQLVHQLRSKIPELGLSPKSPTLHHAPMATDVQAFRNLVHAGSYIEALRVYGGPFLQGKSTGSPEVDLWADVVQADLLVLVDRALQHCVAASTTKEDREVVSAVAEAVHARGYQSPGVMLTLIITSIRADNIKKAEALHATLEAEWGETAAFADLCRIAIPVAQPTAHEESSLRNIRFVGRVDELRQLEEAWDSAKRGSGEIVLITGEPGIGKTRLTNHFLRKIAIQGGRVFTARATAVAKRLAFGGLRDIWEQLLEYQDVLPLHAQELLRRAIGTESSGEVDAASLQQRLDAIFSVISTIASTYPLVLFIDDVQWADEVTAQFLILSSLRLSDAPVLILLAARTEDAEDVPHWIVQELAPTRVLRVGQLSVEAISALLRSFEDTQTCDIPEEVRSKVVWQAAGRPLLLLEGLSAATSGTEPIPTSGTYLPATAEALLKPRFRGLSHEQNWICGLLAVLDRPQRIHKLAEVSQIPDSSVASALKTLVDRGIVHAANGTVSFTHDLMRETAYRQLYPSTRTLLHKRAAEALVNTEDEGLLAQHYASAGDAARAGTYALTAADRARQSGRYSDCEFYYKLAIEAGDLAHRKEAASKLAMHLMHMGRLSEVDELKPLLADYRTEVEFRPIIHLVELESAFAEGRSMAELINKTRQIVALAEESSTASQIGLIIGTLFDIAFDAGDASFGHEVAATVRSVAERSVDDLVRRQARAFLALWQASHLSISAGKLMLSQDCEDPNLNSELATAFVSGVLDLWSGNLSKADATFSKCLAAAHLVGDIRRINACHVNLGLVKLEMAEFDSARIQLEAVLLASNVAHRLKAFVNLAILYYEQRAFSAAMNTVHNINRANRLYVSESLNSTVAAVAGLIALAQGRRSHVDHLFNQVRYTTGAPVPGDLNYTSQFVARVLADRGQLDEALQVLHSTMSMVFERDKLCYIRLRSVEAAVCAKIDADKSYLLAKEVERASRDSDARLILRDVQRVLEYVNR